MKALVLKYLTDTISTEESETLFEWLQKEEHRAVFEQYVREQYDLDLAIRPADVKVAYRKLRGRMEEEEHRKNRKIKKITTYRIKYAAAVIILLGLGYFYQQGYFSPGTGQQLVPEEEPITLQLDNGEIEVIDPQKTDRVTDASGRVVGRQDRGKITYNGDTVGEAIAYNTLKVPYGKRFEVELSDGTAVFLNSGTALKYPVNFREGEDRQVTVTGEAYFKVARDTKHPFIVNTGKLNVRVLGTSFNVSAYPEDAVTDIILVEGKVALYTEDKTPGESTVITPGTRGTLLREAGEISTEAVNTVVYTSWMEGTLVFRNMTFDNILKKLERHYNITIINTNKALGKETFNASFENETIENVLAYLNASYAIDYEIKDNKVFIK